jgi:hypothetical protein
MYNFQIFFFVGNKKSILLHFPISGDTIDVKLTKKSNLLFLVWAASFFFSLKSKRYSRSRTICPRKPCNSYSNLKERCVMWVSFLQINYICYVLNNYYEKNTHHRSRRIFRISLRPFHQRRLLCY